jgi:hypothetical protein
MEISARTFAVDDLYRQRLADRTESLNGARAKDRRIANARFAVFSLGLLIGGIALFSISEAGYLLIPVVIGFVALVLRHDHVIRECERLERAVEFYEQGLARREGRWTGRGKSGERFRDPEHPYSEDLDIFGRGSVYERICTARTAGGQEMLARWLSTQAPPGVVKSRQDSVTELKELVDVREELDLLAVVTRKRIDPGFLSQWAAAPVEEIPHWLRQAALAVAAATVVSGFLWITAGLDPLWFLVSAASGQILYGPYRKRAAAASKHLGHAALELGILAPVLAHLELGPYRSADLARLRERIGRREGESAVEAVRRLQTLDGYFHMNAHIVTRAIVELLVIGPHLANATAEWRKRFGPLIPAWIEAVAEFECLSALASFAYENPGYSFPRLEVSGPIFDARAIIHPLLLDPVTNDIRLDSEKRLFVVSGSNMSGKSTLLRAIGVNAVLAQAGSVVSAKSLIISSLQVGASIRTVDSLQEGVSRFYAEIRRLHAIVELSGKGEPVLFLLDEILHGTNSHDRRIGAEAIVRALLARGAVGLITTHDLAITKIAEQAGETAQNVHFQDELIDGKMSFDYQLRQGVVERSNALELMRAVGLDV